MNLVKKVFAALLCLIMVLRSAPLNRFAGMKFPKLHLPKVELSAFFDLFAPKAKAATVSTGTYEDLTYQLNEDN